MQVTLSREAGVYSADGRVAHSGATASARIVDIAFATTLLIGLSPVMLLAALAIYLEDGGPVLFSQSRVGYGGRGFRCYKFRSMCVDAEDRLEILLARSPEALAEWRRDHKLKIDCRITAVGGFLRKHSLDELPQLLNVLMGEMTFVGPRPIVAAEAPRYGRRFKTYCAMQPGLTGLWQVNGRSDASYRSRVAMDVVYAKTKGPLLDFKILLATIPAVLLGRGSY